jgi:hypothetical protein
MKNLFEEIKNESLNLNEKAEIFRELHTFMAAHPAKRTPSPFWTSSSFLHPKMFVIVASLVLVFITTFGTAFASNYSLPGDLFYPVKILRENIQTLVTVGAKASAEIDAQHAIARLKEVEQLATNGKLNDETKKQIAASFELQTTRALKHIDELKNEGRENDAAAISSDFQTSLIKHQQAISEIRDGSGNNEDVARAQRESLSTKTEERQNDSLVTREKKKTKNESRSEVKDSSFQSGHATSSTSTSTPTKIETEVEHRFGTSTATTTIPVFVHIGDDTEIRSSTGKNERSGEDLERER